MTVQDIVVSVLTLLAGVGVFLVACSMMSNNLESAGSAKLRKLFAKVSGKPLVGVAIGAVGTAAIQSSGAMTVMVIGFVNAGAMTLMQAATLIYGANIGTTITGQIVALGMSGSGSISTTIIFSAFAGVGAFVSSFSKKDLTKKIGGIIAGFGMLFVGLHMMSGAMESFAAMDSVRAFLASVQNGFLLVLIGAVFTAVVQSSSVMTSVAITMVVSGLITIDQGIFITMGSNVGSCVVAVIAGMSSGTNARRTSLIHLLFNIAGTVVFMVLAIIMRLVTGAGFGPVVDRMFPGAPQIQLAMFHTAFNLVTVAVMLPLTGLLLKLVCRMIPEHADSAPEYRLWHVDPHMIVTPPIAVSQVKKEIVNMGSIAMDNFDRALDMITKLDFAEIDSFRHSEGELNFINNALVDFIVKLSRRPLAEKDRLYLTQAIRSIADLERIGDYAENIVEYAESLRSSDERFSVSAIAEIGYLREHVHNLYTLSIRAYVDRDRSALAAAELEEDEVDRITGRMADNHIIRLNEGICTPLVGAQYLSLSANAERIGDHIINIARTITE